EGLDPPTPGFGVRCTTSCATRLWLPDPGAGFERRSLDDLGDDAGAHGAAALADREAQLLVHRDRRDQLHHHLHVVPGHHHLRPLRQHHRARHVRGPEVELRPIPLEERRVPSPPPPWQHLHPRLSLPLPPRPPRPRPAPGPAPRRPCRSPAAAPPRCPRPAPGRAACGTSRDPSPPSSWSP